MNHTFCVSVRMTLGGDSNKYPKRMFLCPRRNFGWHIKIAPSVRPSCLSYNSKTTEANLTKLHRKIEHNEKVCRAQELGSYTQGQGQNQVKGQIEPKIVLLINYWSKFDETSQKDKA